MSESVETNDGSKPNPDNPYMNMDGTVNKKLIGHGFDENGFFQLVIHEDRGIAVLLGVLEQAKDLVKTHWAKSLPRQAV